MKRFYGVMKEQAANISVKVFSKVHSTLSNERGSAGFVVVCIIGVALILAAINNMTAVDTAYDGWVSQWLAWLTGKFTDELV